MSSKLIAPVMRVVNRLRYDVFDNRRLSYSQSGEDLIIDQVFTAMGRKRINYLDLGANHPTHFSNTYLFYRRGDAGVCVEPDPALHPLFKKWRRRDTLLPCGVGLVAGEADFYIMTSNTLNTFSRVEATRFQGYGRQRIESVIRVPLKTIDEILREHFTTCPNLISLDIEGLDFPIVKSMDLERWRPEVFCIETLTYTEDKTERKLDEIVNYMAGRDYMVYGDTYINTVFVDRQAWRRRG